MKTQITQLQAKILLVEAIAFFNAIADSRFKYRHNDKVMHAIERAEKRVMRRSRLHSAWFANLPPETAVLENAVVETAQGATYKPASKYLSNNPRFWQRHYCFCCSNTIPLSYRLTRQPLYLSEFSCGHIRYRSQVGLSGHWLNNTVSRWFKSRMDALRESSGIPVQPTDSFFDPLPLSAYSDLDFEMVGG